MRFAGLGLSVMLGVQLAAPPTAVAADLAEIQRRGYLIVGVREHWRPLGFRDRNGDLVGFEIDIARRLAAALLGDANAVELRPVSNPERLAAVLSDEVDVAIAGVTRTPARTRVVNFSLPYYLDGVGFVSCDRTITRLDHLTQGRIAVLSGSSTIAPLRQPLPQADLIGVASYQEGKARLDQGEADAFAGDVTVLAGWVQEFPACHLLPSLLSAEPLAVVMPKGTQYRALQRRIDTHLNQWHESGWLEERATHWGLP